MMKFDRRQFLEMSGLLGLGAIYGSELGIKPAQSAAFKGDVIIIGAGAAGLTAGFHLKKMGISFTILEAAATFGGRMKVNRDFADFPIPLGAEWLHDRPSVFAEVSGTNTSVETVGYKPSDTYFEISDGEIYEHRLGGYEDRKFINSSWYDFYREFIHPTIASQIRYGHSVKSIKYTENGAEISTRNGKLLEAEKVIITVPLKVLQSGSIHFQPDLPSFKLSAIRSAKAWPGLKMFIKFSEKFYPTFVEYDLPISQGIKNYYDAAYGQKSKQSVMGLFVVGQAAMPFIQGNAYDLAIAELNEIFEGKASKFYQDHITQNWAAEPNINSAYLRDNERASTVKALHKAIDQKIYFAGEAYTKGDDWGGVHNAALAAKSAVKKLIRDG